MGSQTRDYLIAAQHETLTHDLDGNLATDSLWSYTYDAENRLVRMTSLLPSGQGFTRRQLDFNYDYLGRRVEKTVGSLSDAGTYTQTSRRRYLYQGWALVAETDASGTIQRSYTWGPDLSQSVGGAGDVGGLLQITNHNADDTRTAYFPAYDGNGNIAALVSETGALAAIYEYSPFGEPLRAESIDPAVADQPFRFSTRFTDTETGLVYYGHRYYHPGRGRFINRDPMEEAGGIALYAFCRNNAINAYDRLGLKAGDLKATDLPVTGPTIVLPYYEVTAKRDKEKDDSASGFSFKLITGFNWWSLSNWGNPLKDVRYGWPARYQSTLSAAYLRERDTGYVKRTADADHPAEQASAQKKAGNAGLLLPKDLSLLGLARAGFVVKSRVSNTANRERQQTAWDAALDSGDRYAGAVLENFKFWKWPQNLANFVGTQIASAIYDPKNYFGWENNISAIKQQFGTAEGWGGMLGALLVGAAVPSLPEVELPVVKGPSSTTQFLMLNTAAIFLDWKPAFTDRYILPDYSTMEAPVEIIQFSEPIDFKPPAAGGSGPNH